MKKASSILLKIAGIFNIIAAVALFIAGIVYAIMAFAAVESIPAGELITAIEEAVGNAASDLSEEAIKIIISAVLALVFLIGFGVAGIIVLISGIIALKGAKATKKGILIANIVFGVLIENWLAIVGAILGIVGLSIEARKQQQEPQPEPEPEPAPAIEEKPAEPALAPVEEAPKEETKPAKKDWFCPNCGAHNTGKFCQACGTKKPE